MKETVATKLLKTIPRLLVLAAFVLGAAGCATGNVNPSSARANTGYVDFRADPAEELDWEVARLNDRTQDYQVIFSKLKPQPDGVLRLAFSPGHYKLQVTFLNRVIQEPGLIEVDVQNGMITPVSVTLAAEGTTQVQSKEMRVGTTVKGYAGRKTKTSTGESDMFRVSAVADAPMPYQSKEHTVYAR